MRLRKLSSLCLGIVILIEGSGVEAFLGPSGPSFRSLVAEVWKVKAHDSRLLPANAYGDGGPSPQDSTVRFQSPCRVSVTNQGNVRGHTRMAYAPLRC